MQLLAEHADEGFQLGREDHTVLAGQVVEGLDPQLISGQVQRSGPFVEDGESEHSPEPAEAGRTPFAPRFEYDLGVGMRDERGTSGS